MIVKRLGILVVAVLSVAACSSDDSNTSSTGESVSTTTPSDVTTTVPVGTTEPELTTSEAPTTSAAPSTTEEPSMVSEPVPFPATFAAPSGPACLAPPEGGGLQITLDCVDPDVATAPYIDVDEEQTTTDDRTGTTVSYRYIHGGFTDTGVRFAFYFPSPDEYLGRFFQGTYPTVGQEGAGPSDIAFAISHGAAVVTSNNGGGVPAPLAGYRANAAAAKFARQLAAMIYGEGAPVRGYIYGASGGAYQTLGSVENTAGVWDGSVPIVPGVPNAIPSFQGVQVLALRLLEDKWPEIVDALEPGGSGDPYATLDDDERAILEEATRLGHPLRGWWQWDSLKGGAFGITVLAVTGIDASYVDDFWNEPGYEGADDPDVQAARVRFDTTIAAIDGEVVTLADEPPGFVLFADVVVNSGEAADSEIVGASVVGDVALLPGDIDSTLVENLAVGDRVTVDNSLWIALEYYQRHQVPGAEYEQYGWDQYRDADGNPIPAQRPALVGHIISDVFGGLATGDFNGKMIMISSVLDVQAFPWSADWYLEQAANRSDEPLDDRFRLWYLDNTDHQPPNETEGYAHIVLYNSPVRQALLDLDDWVANDTSPAATTSYEITDDNQVVLTGGAADRGGLQPVVSASIDAGDGCTTPSGDVRADVTSGDPVSFTVTAAAPAATGQIVKIEWDWESTGEFADWTDLEQPSADIELCETHTYDEPGTHFAVVRVTAQRDGNAGGYTLVQNLARVRIVVA